MTSRPVVAVIGAGFSGLLTALHLLSDPDGPQVRLIERRGVFGRGLAYATDNADHLLNVRVGNMSALPDDPDHFVRWLSSHSGWRANGAFVTRGVYGDYLQSLLREAVGGGAATDRLLLEADETVQVNRMGARWRMKTAMGREIVADTVVLALGSPTPGTPSGLAESLQRSRRYVADPWGAEGLPEAPGGHVLLVGTGLTMIDVVMTLAQPGRRFTAISRRGLTPAAHGHGPPRIGTAAFIASPLQALRRVRRQSRDRDWREVIDEMRVAVRPLWMSWTQDQRRAFLRHVRPWWDAHRHRMAPPVARQINAMIANGQLTIHAGVTTALRLDGDEVDAAWRPRGSRRARHLRASAVINCTGQHGDLAHSVDPLIHALLAQDLIRPDPYALGADVDARSRPLDTWGAVTPGLYAVGPLTRSAFWEITSVPDIRVQAIEVAREILRQAHASA